MKVIFLKNLENIPDVLKKNGINFKFTPARYDEKLIEEIEKRAVVLQENFSEKFLADNDFIVKYRQEDFSTIYIAKYELKGESYMTSFAIAELNPDKEYVLEYDDDSEIITEKRKFPLLDEKLKLYDGRF